MNTSCPIEAFVLAGGKSSRMGQDKGTMLLGDRPMIAPILDTLQSLPLPVKIIANTWDYHGFGIPVVKDVIAGKGPAGGLLTAFQHAASPYVFLVSCDTPFVSREAALRLLAMVSDEQVIVPEVRNVIYPLFALYHRSLMPKLVSRVNEGRLKMKEMVFAADYHQVCMNDLVQADPYLFFNINQMSDIAQCRQRWKQT